MSITKRPATTTATPHSKSSRPMRAFIIASAVLATAGSLAGVSAQPQTAQIYIQPLGISSAPPAPLAEITYDLSNSGSSDSPSSDGLPQAEVTAYEAPEFPESSTIARIGIYDPSRKEWVGATSAASVENFAKGYAPHFLVNLVPGEKEVLLGASLKGVRIDAGQTRDFGPQVKLVVASRGKQPELNRPVVLSPEGKKVEKEEKTFLQKCALLSRDCPYWCVMANISSQVLVDDRYRIATRYGRRRRRKIELHRKPMQTEAPLNGPPERPSVVFTIVNVRIRFAFSPPHSLLNPLSQRSLLAVRSLIASLR